MAKEHTSEKKDRKNKEKHAEADGVKKDKKDKKEKKAKRLSKSTDAEAEELALVHAASTATEPDESEIQAEDGDAMEVDTVKNGDDEKQKMALFLKEHVSEVVVPFAFPMADDKAMKKLYKGVKKAAKHKTLKRGVKEVVKSLRKSDDTPGPHAIVIIAGDISPMDVISHIPVLCEDHNVPYAFVPSRAELGAAGNTTRPTSVVMITKTPPKNKKGTETDSGDWDESYGDVLKTVQKLQKQLKV